MYFRSGKRRRGIQAVSENVSKTSQSNPLVIELLEPRLLLSGLGDDHGDYTWNATPTVPDTIYNGFIGNLGFDRDMFSFVATSGANYAFAAGYDTLPSIKLSLIDSNGFSVLDSNSNFISGEGSAFGWTAPTSGIYYLKVESPWYQIGAYDLAFTEEVPVDDYGDTPQTASHITKNIWTSGNIETLGDKDCFYFYASVGNTYTIETSTSGLTDTFLWLYDSNGVTLLDADDDSGVGLASKITWTPQASGYRYITVEPSYSGIDFTGTYSLRYTESIVLPEIVELDVNTVWYDELDSLSDRDIYSFQAEAGHTYTFRTSGALLLPATDPILTLYDSDGTTQLLQDDDSGFVTNALITWTAPQNGEYYLEVSSFSGDTFTPGTYGLSIIDGVPEWTLMCYIAADNNLEQVMLPDIIEMIEGSWLRDIYTPQVNILCLVDMVGDEDVFVALTPGYDEVYLEEEINMGDPNTIIDFVNEAAQYYPAKKYGLIVWDHGGGFLGTALDENLPPTDNQHRTIDNLDMADFTLLEDSLNIHLSFLGFNACVMAGIEPVYQMRNLSNIYVGSEPSEYGDPWNGSVWNYSSITDQLLDDPYMDENEFAELVVNSYQELYNTSQYDGISAIKLSEVENLAISIDAFSNYMLSQATSSDWHTIQVARNSTLQVVPDEIYPYHDFCDIGNVVQNIINTSHNTTLKSYAEDILDALQHCIQYEWHDQNLTGATGLTIYFPNVGGIINSAYNSEIKFLQDTHWDEFVEFFVSGSYPKSIEIPTKGLAYTDSDGTLVTVKLTNSGGIASFSGQVTNVIEGKKGVQVQGQNLELGTINLTSSNNQSAALTIKTKGGSVEGATLGGITGNSLWSLNAKGIDLVGDIDLNGSLGSIVVNDIFDNVTITTGVGIYNGLNLKANRIGDNVVFDLTGAVKKFQANSYSSGELIAKEVGQIKINSGKFGADIKAHNGNIQSVMARNTITGDIMASGSIGKIACKQGSFTGAARAGKQIASIQAYSLQGAIISAGSEVGKVNIKGNIIDSYIIGGYDIGTDCAFGLQLTGGGDLPGSGNVNSIIAKGMFASSYICAGTLSHAPLTDSAMLDVGLPYVAGYGSIGKVKFGNVDLNAPADFGLFAATEIKPFKIGKSVAQSNGHFRVEVLS